MTLPQISAMSLLTKTIVNTPNGVRGHLSPLSVCGISLLPSPVGAWALAISFADDLSWCKYLDGMNRASHKLDTSSELSDICCASDSMLWVANRLKQWLSSVMIHREGTSHLSSLDHMRYLHIHNHAIIRSYAVSDQYVISHPSQ
jgi:hypothetical protein